MNRRIGGRTTWRDWILVIALVVGFLGVIVSILAVGKAILGAVDRARAEIAVVGERIDESVSGQAEIRERLVALALAAGFAPPPPHRGCAV